MRSHGDIHVYLELCSVIHRWDSAVLAGDVVFVKMPSRQQTKLREEYLQSRDDELESSRVQYNADPEQNRAFAHDGN